jgi:hypothetical protein
MLLYRSEDGHTKLDVRLEGGTVWLSQAQLVELFGKAKETISEHINHIFEDVELDKKSVVRSFRTTALDGKQYDVAYYNLDMMIALAFRVHGAARKCSVLPNTSTRGSGNDRRFVAASLSTCVSWSMGPAAETEDCHG